MAEYIERGTAIAKLTALEVFEPNATTVDARRLLADMPAADVAPVAHGRWTIRVDPTTGLLANCKCSRCGGTAYDDSKYCPNCGAKMDESMPKDGAD